MPDFAGNILVGLKNLLNKINLREFLKNKYMLGSLIGVVVIALGLVGYLIYSQKAQKPTGKREIPRPTILPLPKGFQSWDFQFGNGVKGPKIQTATIDTLTPPRGATQTLTLTIKNDSPVTSAMATLYTDNTSATYPLTLKKGTSTDGTWAGTWTINDTYNYIYHINIDLKSSTGGWTGALSFR